MNKNSWLWLQYKDVDKISLKEWIFFSNRWTKRTTYQKK